MFGNLVGTTQLFSFFNQTKHFSQCTFKELLIKVNQVFLKNTSSSINSVNSN